MLKDSRAVVLVCFILVASVILPPAFAQEQELPPMPPLRLGNIYIPTQVAVTFGLPNAIIGYFVKPQGTLPEQWNEVTARLAPDALTMVWTTNVTNSWTLDFFVNYTLVVDQWVNWYAFGPDSNGNNMGSEAIPVHLTGRNVWLRFELRTIVPPKPPTEAELNAWQQSSESPYMKGQATTNTRLTTIEDYGIATIVLLLIAIVIMLIGKLPSRIRRR